MSAQAAPPSENGLELMRTMIAEGTEAPMGLTLGCRLVQVKPGFAAVEGEPSVAFYNPGQTVHGGWSSTLIDSACDCACAASSTLPAGHTASTIELKVTFHRLITVRTGWVRAESRVVNLGRQVVACEAVLKDSAGRLLASGSSTLLILKV